MESKTKAPTTKTEKKTPTATSYKTKSTRETIVKDKEKDKDKPIVTEQEVSTPRGGAPLSAKSDNQSTTSNSSPLINKSMEMVRPVGDDLSMKFENRLELITPRPEVDTQNLIGTGNINTGSGLTLTPRETNTANLSSSQGFQPKPKKKEVLKGSPKPIAKIHTGAPSTWKLGKKPVVANGSSERPATGVKPVSTSESAKKDKNDKSVKGVPDKLPTLKQERSGETGGVSMPNLFINTSADSPHKALIVNENSNNTENVDSENNSPDNNLEAYHENAENVRETEITEEDDSPVRPDFNIAHYYKKEKGRVNVWTYLFKNLYRAINEIHSMCENDRSIEFNNGVISTFESAIGDFKKLNYKVEIDKVDKAKALAWDISPTTNELANRDELENCFDDLEDPDTINFTLLTDMVKEGKMSLNEAMVLLVRERAILADDQYNANPLDNYSSFISRGASEIFFDYTNTKEHKDDSASLAPSFRDNLDSARRSRSVTPGRISLAKLANRISWKLASRYQDSEDEESQIERIRSKVEQKQARAESNRKESETLRKDYIQREREKQLEARERIEEKKVRSSQKYIRRLDEAQERYEARIQSIRNKAKNESAKVDEVAFIMQLENQNKRLTLDEKLSDTRERRLKILNKIKNKQTARGHKEVEVNKRREQIKKESLQKILKSQTKIELAEERREKILQDKKRQFVEESSKILSAGRRKKRLLQKLEQEQVEGGDQPIKDYVTKLKLLKKKLIKDKRKIDSRGKDISRNNSKLASPEPKPNVDVEEESGSMLSLPNGTDESQEVTSTKSFDELLYAEGISPEPYYILFYEPRRGYPELGTTSKSYHTEIKQELQSIKESKVKKSKPSQKIVKKKPAEPVVAKSIEEKRLFLVRSKSAPPAHFDSFESHSSAKEKHEAPRRQTVDSSPTASTKARPKTADSGVLTIITDDKTKITSTNTDPRLKEDRKHQKQGRTLFDSSLSSPEKDKDKERDGSYSGKRRLSSGKTSNSGNLTRKEKTPLLSEKEDTQVVPPKESIGENEGLEEDQGSDEKRTKDHIANRDSEEAKKDREGKENECPSSGITIRWCSNCDFILDADASNEDHIQSKHHRKIKAQYNLSNNDDQNCILEIKEEDAFSKLKTERLNTVRRRCKKIKQKMLLKALKHESVCMMGKEASSLNKQRLQKLCFEIDKQVSPPQIKDYEYLDNTLKEVIKILDLKREADLHLMRQLKFVPIIMEICKRVTVCHKNEVNTLLRTLDFAIKIVSKFTGLIDNRTYMILTNRLGPLIDLLIWCLNRPTKFVYSLAFVPQLFNLLSMHLKHRLTIENAHYKEDLIEYIFCSGLMQKLQQKFMSFNTGLDLSTSMGKVPLALLKSVGFLEVLTNAVSTSHNFSQSVFETKNVSENITLVLSETELVGMIFLTVALLLSDGSYTKNSNKVLPQTVLSLTMTSVKYLNNIARFDLKLLQRTMGGKVMREQVYHIFSYLITYCNENYNSSEDVKDLLNELLLLIGYFCVLNVENQELLAQGTPTIVQKMTGLPFNYFTDKKLKDILYPTLFCVAFKDTRNLEIIYQDIALDHLEKYLMAQIQLFPLESIYEENLQPMIESSNHIPEKKVPRALSISSNNSSTTSLLAAQSSNTNHFLFLFRFPRNMWGQLLQFIMSP